MKRGGIKLEESRKQFYLKVLNNEISPALGCTEPAAVSLCAAGAAEALGEEVEQVEITMYCIIKRSIPLKLKEIMIKPVTKQGYR